MFDFEKPNIEIAEISEDKKYGKFVVEPLERGYGTTLGNSLRRIMLSSLPGSAVSQVKIDGVLHEFSSIPGVKEDVTEIIMNVKNLAIKNNSDTNEPKTAYIEFEGEGVITAADLDGDGELTDADIEILNPEQVIATLSGGTDSKFYMELTITNGRGYVGADKNRNEDLPIGVISVDSIYTPVERVNMAVENTRVGQMTDYDKLILEVWTDGRISPADAMLQASAILRHHLDVFVNYDDKQVNFEEAPSAVQDEETARLRKLLNMSVNEIELSVRAANCLNNANITTVGQLAMKSESEMLKYRNFGKKSLNEIKDKLLELGLSLGVQVDPSLLTGPVPQAKPRLGLEEESPVGLADLIAANIEDDDD